MNSWMDLLKQYRDQSIADGKIIGEQLCRAHGTTHSRAILDEMNRRGLRKQGVPDFWIGAVLKDPRFVCTGRVVRPPIPRNSAIHDAHLIWLWRLRSSGVAPLILYEYIEFCDRRPPPTAKQRVEFILRHVVIRKPEGVTWWYAATCWLDDEHTEAIKSNPTPYGDWVRLFINLQNITAGSQTKARAEARRLVTLFVETH